MRRGLVVVYPIASNALVALDVEAGAVELRHVCEGWFDGGMLVFHDDPHTALVALTTRILTACGVHVPDEVHEFGCTFVTAFPWDDGGFSRFVPGDIITITRKEGE